jgi:hypothetical protein
LRIALGLRAQVKEVCDAAEAQAYQVTAKEISNLVQASKVLNSQLESWQDTNSESQPRHVGRDTTTALQHVYNYPAQMAATYFETPKICVYHTRLLFIHIKLQESLIEALSALVEAMEFHQSRSHAPMITSSTFAAVDRLIMRHVTCLQQNVDSLIGSTAYRFGDLDERGNLTHHDHIGTSHHRTLIATDAISSVSRESTIPLPVIEISSVDDTDAIDFDYEFAVGEKTAMMEQETPRHSIQRLNVPSKLRSIEPYIHLMDLQRCPYVSDEQAAVVVWALRRAGEELRRS